MKKEKADDAEASKRKRLDAEIEKRMEQKTLAAACEARLAESGSEVATVKPKFKAPELKAMILERGDKLPADTKVASLANHLQALVRRAIAEAPAQGPAPAAAPELPTSPRPPLLDTTNADAQRSASGRKSRRRTRQAGN